MQIYCYVLILLVHIDKIKVLLNKINNMFVNKINKYDDVMRFIELYRSHEVLYNTNNPSYRRNDLKIAAYNSIAAETKMTVEEVKKKIKSFRTSYCAEKSKIETSKKSGCDTESLYIPSVFWFNKMAFLDAFLIRRKTVDNCNQEAFSTLTKRSSSSEPTDVSYLEFPIAQKEKSTTPSTSQKRKHALDPTSKLDDALEKLIAITQDTTAFEAFGESVAKQIKDFPEEDAYEVMADIQSVISKRKVEILRRKHLYNPPITSSPLSEDSSSDALFSVMPEDVEIKEEYG